VKIGDIMSNLKYELSLLNSPYFDKLLKEMKIILEQKRKLLSGIRNKTEFQNNLSFSDKGIYGSIIKRENELLKEMAHIKGWKIIENGINPVSSENINDFDIYDNNISA
jgi:hypothetical protein